jgi:hypothetical protein
MDKAVPLAGVFLLFSGTAHAILLKAQDNAGFMYPYFQCATIFLGELLCLAVYALLITCSESTRNNFRLSYVADPAEIDLIDYEHADNSLAKRLGFYIFSIPAAIDGISSVLSNLGLMLSTVSVYQMLKYGNTLFYFVVYAFVLKRKVLRPSS